MYLTHLRRFHLFRKIITSVTDHGWLSRHLTMLGSMWGVLKPSVVAHAYGPCNRGTQWRLPSVFRTDRQNSIKFSGVNYQYGQSKSVGAFRLKSISPSIESAWKTNIVLPESKRNLTMEALGTSEITRKLVSLFTYWPQLLYQKTAHDKYSSQFISKY